MQGVSRSGYYQWRREGSVRARRNEEITYKREAVHAAMQPQGEQVGSNRVARLMKVAGHEGRQRRRYRVRSTESRHEKLIARNRLAESSAPSKPDEAWVADITFVETAEGWRSIASVLDLYGRRLISMAHAAEP